MALTTRQSRRLRPEASRGFRVLQPHLGSGPGGSAGNFC